MFCRITCRKINSQFPLEFNRFVWFNKQKINIFLLKIVIPNLEASFALFGVEIFHLET